MATGICYTQSGNVRRYEDGVTINLVKGIHDLPTLSTTTTNIRKYEFDVSSSYNFVQKGVYRGDMPLVFVTYYPSYGKNPCYFNFNYNTHKLTIFLYLLTPKSTGSNVFNKIKYNINNESKLGDLDNDSKITLNVTDKDNIIFDYTKYKSRYDISQLLKTSSNIAINYGLTDDAKLNYYNTTSNVTDDMFTLYHKLNGTKYTTVSAHHHNISISNITEDSIAYMYVVPRYIYVHPVHAGFSPRMDSDATDYIWNDTEDSINDRYTQYKMSCSGRKSNTGSNYDSGPWGAPHSGDGGNRYHFRDISYPVGIVRHSDNNKEKEKWYNYHLGVKLTTSLYEYEPSSIYTVYRSIYTRNSNSMYFTYNGVCDNYLKTLNNSPYPNSSYFGDSIITNRYIEPYNSYIPYNDAKRGNYETVTYAKQFPQNNTYIALDRTSPDNSAREAATTMPPQFWVGTKINCWGEFVKAKKDNFGLNYVAPPMILQGLICGGSGGDRNHEALGLFSAISLKGKNKNPNKLMFHADVYNTYFDPNISQQTIGTINQPYNSYIITGRIKNGGRSGSELPIWQKFRFDVWNNIDEWIEEYG